MSSSSFYGLRALLSNGSEYNFDQLRGKVVLIVNVASKCGFATQYEGLQKLHDKYANKGFVLLGFPSGQFKSQEFDTDAEISNFCSLNYGGIKFPIMKKCDVNGENTNEVFKWLKSQKSGILGMTRIKWNFEKFLVDKEGNVVNRYATTTEPSVIEAEIAKLLEA